MTRIRPLQLFICLVNVTFLSLGCTPNANEITPEPDAAPDFERFEYENVDFDTGEFGFMGHMALSGDGLHVLAVLEHESAVDYAGIRAYAISSIGFTEDQWQLQSIYESEDEYLVGVQPPSLSFDG